MRRWLKKLKALWKRFYWFFEGAYRTAQLEDARSLTRTDAEKAVDRILRSSALPPDCVGATVVRGGCAILVTHTINENKRQEAFVHNTYDEAATKALEWLKTKDLKVGGQSKYNRESRRAYKAKHRKQVTSKPPR